MVSGSLDEVNSGGDVSPLIASTNLTNAAVVLMQMEIVVGLETLIGEFRETHTVLRVNSLVHTILR